MFTTQNSRSGELTFFINGKAVHSLYNPTAEADTFLKRQIFTNIPQIFILIGPGLGYLKKSVKSFYPDAHLLSIHLDKWIFERSDKTGDYWIYKNELDLASKLSRTIPDFLLSETAVIEWHPCSKHFPDRTKYVKKLIKQFFQERKGTIVTTGHFGRKWIRNAYYNFLKQNNFVKFNSINLPILIAASGPSLKESISMLRNKRNKFILAALPSSLSALNTANLRPDFIFHTDPGYWANEHLKYIQDTNIPVIMPLTSSFNSNIKNPVVYINQGSFIENLILGNFFPHVPSHGTVAGTAYLFLRKITDNPIIFLGLDFRFTDIMEHVSPHSFDILYNIKQNRFDGYLNILYEKQQMSTTKALSTYSGWFDSKTRISNAYRYNPTDISTDGLISIDFKKLSTLLNTTIQRDRSKLLINETNLSFNKNTLINVLKHLIVLLDKFKSEIPFISSDGISAFFITSNPLAELFQYTAYSDILKLTNYYRNDLDKSRDILNRIFSEAKAFITGLLKRSNYER
ncbi:MAG: motility associated factor glycosyltransferase family protein [Spirochaetales bacterium]|nr:motility associated factor glycosyltransferase family protein [Spirochaetales bacterium]